MNNKFFSNKKAVMITILIGWAAYIIVFFTLGRSVTYIPDTTTVAVPATVYFNLAIDIILSAFCIVLSAWLLLPKAKCENPIKYLCLSLAQV